MNCRDALDAIDAALDGELDDRLPLDEHLAACASCARHAADRRAFSERLGSALRVAFRDVEPAPGEKEQAVRLMIEATRRRLHVGARLAAALVMAASVGVVAYAFGLFGNPTRAERAEAAETIARVEALEKTCDAKSRALLQAIADLERQLPDNGGTQPFSKLFSLVTAEMTAKLAGEPAPLPPAANPEQRVDAVVHYITSPDPRRRAGAIVALKKLDAACVPFLLKARTQVSGSDAFLVDAAVESLQGGVFVEPPHGRPAIDITQKQGAAGLRFRQYPNAVIELEIDGKGTVVAADMEDLLANHPDLCQRFRISGADGDVRVGDIASSAGAVAPARGAMQFWVQSDASAEGVEREAERALKVVLAMKCDDEQAERIAQDVTLRVNALPAPQFREEAAAEARSRLVFTLQQVHGLGRQELAKARGSAAERARSLESRLQEIEELSVRVDKLKVYLDAVREVQRK